MILFNQSSAFKLLKRGCILLGSAQGRGYVFSRNQLGVLPFEYLSSYLHEFLISRYFWCYVFILCLKCLNNCFCTVTVIPLLILLFEKKITFGNFVSMLSRKILSSPLQLLLTFTTATSFRRLKASLSRFYCSRESGDMNLKGVRVQFLHPNLSHRSCHLQK